MPFRFVGRYQKKFMCMFEIQNFLTIQTYLIPIFFNQFLSGHKGERKKKGRHHSYLKHVTTYPKTVFLKAKARKRQRNNRHIFKSNIAYKFCSKSQLQNNAFFMSYLRDKI